MDKRSTVIKWYKRLGFPEKYDGRFEALLSLLLPMIRKEFSENAEDNFLTALYQCEALEQKYREMGIGQKVLYDIAQGFVRPQKILCNRQSMTV